MEISLNKKECLIDNKSVLRDYINVKNDMVKNLISNHTEESADFSNEKRVIMPLLHKHTILEFKDSHDNTLFQKLNLYGLKSFTYPSFVNRITGNNGYIDILFTVGNYGNYIKEFLNNYEKIDSIVYTLREMHKRYIQDVAKIILHNPKVEYLTFETDDNINSMINCRVTITYDKASYI